MPLLAITGAAYCYECSGGNWAVQDVIAPAIAVGDFFGSVVNAYGDYLFERQIQGRLTFWTQILALSLGETEGSGDELGCADAIADAYIFAAAPQLTVIGYHGAGRVQDYGSKQIFADGFE